MSKWQSRRRIQVFHHLFNGIKVYNWNPLCRISSFSSDLLLRSNNDHVALVHFNGCQRKHKISSFMCAAHVPRLSSFYFSKQLKTHFSLITCIVIAVQCIHLYPISFSSLSFFVRVEHHTDNWIVSFDFRLLIMSAWISSDWWWCSVGFNCYIRAHIQYAQKCLDWRHAVRSDCSCCFIIVRSSPQWWLLLISFN